jgi:RNA polymerase sigma-70 factor (ECF subfamily)
MVMSVVRGPLSIAGDPKTDPVVPVAARAVGGDRAALQEILVHVSPTVLRGLRSMLGTSDVDDALQESLLAFTRALPAWRGETNLRRYALRIGIRTALAARRQERQRRGMFDDHVRVSEPLAAPPRSPSDDSLALRRREAFRALLDELPEAQAEALALRVVFEYSLDEVAQVTGAPINTVRSRVRVGLETLRARIEGDDTLKQLMEVAS